MFEHTFHPGITVIFQMHSSETLNSLLYANNWGGTSVFLITPECIPVRFSVVLLLIGKFDIAVTLKRHSGMRIGESFSVSLLSSLVLELQ